ncbi:MAG: hypothetical protein JWN04_931 [Myxococcaceae bacterium]|nr:hypothetical protein [Myxococcaceae bacterium]
MEALKRLTLALTIALVGAACGDDSDSGPKGNLDGGFKPADGGADGGAAHVIPTKIILPDGGALPCASNTPPANGFCGGSSCQQTQADLQKSAKTGATCGAMAEVASFCSAPSTGAVKVVSDCAYGGAVIADVLSTPPDYAKFAADTKSCAKPMLTDISEGCLDCFVGSARCTAEKCVTQCLTPGDVCDACRIATGCIKQFYDCAGYADPLAPIEAAFGL